jgi:hypothetical protein
MGDILDVDKFGVEHDAELRQHIAVLESIISVESLAHDEIAEIKEQVSAIHDHLEVLSNAYKQLSSAYKQLVPAYGNLVESYNNMAQSYATIAAALSRPPPPSPFSALFSQPPPAKAKEPSAPALRVVPKRKPRRPAN